MDESHPRLAAREKKNPPRSGRASSQAFSACSESKLEHDRSPTKRASVRKIWAGSCGYRKRDVVNVADSAASGSAEQVAA